MKLGEILVRKGLIDQAQLKEALEAQLIFGGHLGTCLMELGYVTELNLAGVLADIHEVGVAPPGWFENIPQYVTSAFDERLSEKHRSVPFRLNDRVLDVAMVNPKDLMSRDELSFASGYKIRSFVAPEARIFQAMERYYDIPRRLRYVTLCKQIDKNTVIEPQVPSSSRVAAMREAVRGQARPRAVLPPTKPSPAPAAGTVAPAPPAPAPARARVTATPTAAAAAVLESPSEIDPLEPLSQRLVRADSIDEVSDLALEHASLTLERCLIFLVRSGKALPWRSTGIKADQSRWSNISFTITSEPIFALPNGEELYRGPVPRQAVYQRFYDALGIGMPNDEVVLLPAHADDRLVAVFYGDGGAEGRIRGNNDDYRRLVQKTALAINVAQLRRKILSI
jgi:hypothetical protein